MVPIVIIVDLHQHLYVGMVGMVMRKEMRKMRKMRKDSVEQTTSMSFMRMYVNVIFDELTMRIMRP